MIKRRYPVKLKKGQELYLWTLGDVGFAGPRCDTDALKSDLDWILKKKNEGHLIRIIGLGDWLAFPSPSERAALIAAKGGKGFYDSTLAILDEAMLDRCNKWIEFMRPVHGCFLGTVHGHHVYDFSGESDFRRCNSDQYICKQLGCDYYGDMGLIRLEFEGLDYHEIPIHHGYGSGRTHGTAVSKRERVFEGFEGDLVVMGHDNRRMANTTHRIRFNGYREKRSVASGAYERAYRLGQAHNGYVEELLLNPSAIGATMILFEEWGGRLRVRALV